MTRAGRLCVLAAGALLAACAGAPPAAPIAVPVPAVAPPTPLREFEQHQRERAQTALREGRLADAADAWEILALLRPTDADVAEGLATTRRTIAADVDDHLAHARQAWKRGEFDAAVAQYLAVIALQPDQAQAADALRAIERERNRRALAKAAGASARKSGVDAPAAPGTAGP